MSDQNGLEQSQLERLQNLKRHLDEIEAKYEIIAQVETVISADEGVERGIGDLEEMAPTLILETERGPLAAIIRGGTRLSYKKIKKELGLKNVSLATPDKVLEQTGAAVGTVSLINAGFPTIVDSQLINQDMIYGGCGIPHHTLCIRVADLIKATQAQVFDFTEPKIHRSIGGQTNL